MYFKLSKHLIYSHLHTGKQSDADCVPCDPGFYCQESGQANVTGECYAGYYCVEGADTPTPLNETGYICPIGNYCPQGSYAPIACPNATYMNHTGAEECYVCPEGYYCTNRDRTDECPQGKRSQNREVCLKVF